MSNQNVAKYFEVSDEEVEEVLTSTGISSGIKDESIITSLRLHVRSILEEKRNAVRRLANSIAEKYGVDASTYEIKFTDSEESKRDQDIHLLGYTFDNLYANLEMIASDNKRLSSVDVQRYTSDSGKSLVFTPSQVAANALETVERYYEQKNGDPTARLRADLTDKYADENGNLQFDASDEGVRDKDIYTVLQGFTLARQGVELIAAKGKELSSDDVRRFDADGTEIFTPGEVAAYTIRETNRILRNETFEIPEIQTRF